MNADLSEEESVGVDEERQGALEEEARKEDEMGEADDEDEEDEGDEDEEDEEDEPRGENGSAVD